MYNLPEKPTVYFDVDNTLVFAQSDLSMTERANLPAVYINGRQFYKHDNHIEKIKEFKARGHNVIVWSAGGSGWAQMVVYALELSPYVDLVLSKPYWYFDDLDVKEWMKDRCYINA